jgi:hypothetical protein
MDEREKISEITLAFGLTSEWIIQHAGLNCYIQMVSECIRMHALPSEIEQQRNKAEAAMAAKYN